MLRAKAIKKTARDIEKKLVKIRQDFHKYPEIYFEEKRTSPETISM